MNRILVVISLLFATVASHYLATSADSCATSPDQFTTITTYTSALDYLQCQRDAGQLAAHIFDSDSIESKHIELIRQQCEPHTFIMIGRHAARSPDEGEIEQFNGDLMDLVELVHHNMGSRSAISDSTLRSSRLLEPEYEFETFDIASNNLLTGVGLREQQELAARLKQVYPKFFNARETQIHLGTTSKLRTAQTATEFARAIDNFDLGPECPKSDDDPTMACYKHVLGAHSKIELEYHKVCKKQIKDQAKKLTRAGKPAPTSASEPLSPEVTKTFEKISKLRSELLDKLAVKVSNKLAMQKEGQITRKHIESAYNVCRYEIAAKSSSVWCDLFDTGDLQALDYLDDANIYHKINARLESNKLQACPIVKEVVVQLATSASGESTQREAHFGFTHVGVLKKILAVFGMFEPNQVGGSGGYTEADLEAFELAHLNGSTLDAKRQWRTSLMVPFSANVNFVLYKCQGDQKILTTVSEQPVRFRGCSDSACPVSEFMAAYGHMQSCDPGRVCEEVAKGLGEGQLDE